jgi:thiol:disulfide interchange protein
MRITTSLAFVLALAACNPPAERAAETATTAPAAAAPSAAAAPAALAPPAAPAAPAAPTAVNWLSWEQGSALARAENRPMMLFVYADWCDRCRELRPIFNDPRVVEASRGLILVQQDHDQEAPWLQSVVGDTESYVPRVMFLNPDGTQKTELVSPHPRYPLFYVPQMVDILVSNMTAARGG